MTQPKLPSTAEGSAAVPPGYKGLIPEDWETVPLARLSEFITKGSTPTTYGFKWEESGVLFLRSECVSEQGLDLGRSMFISPAAHALLRRSEVRDGDILITITGNVGRVVLLMGIGTANLNQHIARIRISAPSVDARYVYHFLSQSAVRRRFNSITTGQAYPQISLQQVREAKVALPPRPEQHAIAEALSDVDWLIGALDKLVAKKRAIKQAALQQLLTGKTRLPGFTDEWRSCTLGDLGPFSKGRGIKRDEVSDEGVACIRYGELYTRYQDYVITPVSRLSPDVALAAWPIKTGDLLFAGSGETAEEIGRCAAYLGEEDAYAGGDIIVLTPTGQNSLYLGHLMNHETVAAQKARLGQGDAVVHISARNLAQVEIELPPVEEQTAIATVLSDMDAEIAGLERRRDKTNHIKRGMMQSLLTGRVRLVNPPEAEARA